MATEKRLIDATPIIDECKECSAIEWNKKIYTTWAEAEEEFMERLLDAPVVDAVEVVHGHWGEYEVFKGAASLNGYPCSACGKRVSAKTNYCPNCGAKMDGGEA